MTLPDLLNTSFLGGAAFGAGLLVVLAAALGFVIAWIARDCDHD